MRTLIRPLVLLSALAALAACGEAKDPATTPTAPEQAAASADPSVSMPEDAPPQEEAVGEAPMVPTPADTAGAEAGSCTAEIGRTAAAKLVERCIAVSPATHPPCNASNPCEMIQGEIDRSCAMYGPGETKPGECAA